ncbi:MAG: murein L,D-transpeptidase [Pikeienuella sp.]
MAVISFGRGLAVSAALIAGSVGPLVAQERGLERAPLWQAAASSSISGGEDALQRVPGVGTAPAAAAEAEAIARKLAGQTGDVAAAYAARGHAPIWLAASDAAAARVTALLSALAEAPSHALPADRYDHAGLVAALSAAEAAGADMRADVELRLTEAFLRYARDVSSGVLEPNRIDRDIHHRPERPQPKALLAGLLAADDATAMIEALAPAHPDYDRLRGELQGYLQLARSNAWAAELPKGSSLRLGDQGARVETLRRRLIAVGDLTPASATPSADPDGTRVAANHFLSDTPLPTATDPAVFDPALMDAVKRFQGRHGLNQDGVVGPATRAALNTGPAKRARQIAVNLERLRWLNKDLGRRHVMVNLASFDVVLMEDGAAIYRSRTVIGKNRHATPEFSDEMEYMVINPTWHVPRSIATKEILPKLQADPTYLSRKGMRIEGADLPAEEIDWAFVTPSTFPGRIKQRPGSGNALGKVKFMFPNKWSIYLHDTPHKSLFKRDRRAYSHGCVRVQEPFDFAYALLAPQVDDPRAFFHGILRRGRERYVNLDRHVPVHITYRTAWVDETGADQFRGDVYGRDAKVYAALARAGLDFPADID